VHDRSIFSSPEVVMSALPIAPATPPTPPLGAAPLLTGGEERAVPRMAAPPPPLGGAAPALEVRDLGPADGHLLDALHAAMSPRSRFQRYHGAKPRLSRREREFLTATDGRDHVALVALEGGAPVAVARYIRLKSEPGAADVAAEVVDARQRQGLGTDLLTRVARRAAAAGIERLTATILSETGLRAVLVRHGWRVRSYDGPTTTLEADVWTLLTR
jgi:GNAT superfamily N-acetyltransferase